MKSRAYERKIGKALPLHKSFFLKQLRDEWEEVERSARAEEKVRQAKATAAVVGKSLLVLLALAGVATVAAVAPNLFSAFGRSRRYRGFYSKREFREALVSLRRKKLVSVQKENEILKISPTEKGIQKVFSISYAELRLKPLDRWDGVWRLVLFDIPNRHKWARDCLREKLKDMRFYPLQKSVFLTPYPCESELQFLISVLNVPGDAVRVIETRSVGKDRHFREIFGV